MDSVTDRLYARIPAVACQRRCQRSCVPVQMLPHERARITAGGGHHLSHVGPACALLDERGACSVYDQRPAICRLWGAVDTMPCPHGCQPERWMTEAEALALLDGLRAWSMAR